MLDGGAQFQTISRRGERVEISTKPVDNWMAVD
jgi:hypothetical protein